MSPIGSGQACSAKATNAGDARTTVARASCPQPSRKLVHSISFQFGRFEAQESLPPNPGFSLPSFCRSIILPCFFILHGSNITGVYLQRLNAKMELAAKDRKERKSRNP